MTTESTELPVSSRKEIPISVFFFANGMAAVCNDTGEQIPKYQGRHAATVAALEKDGYNWMKLNVMGAPSS